MSKQQKNKTAQNYRDKPVWPICSNCANCNTVITYPDPKWPNYFKETNTCRIGEFVVKKMATCDKHMIKLPEITH